MTAPGRRWGSLSTMLLKALVAARDLGRLHEIAKVLARQGFGDLLHRTGVYAALERAGKALHIESTKHVDPLSPAERTRQVFEQLGPTFVKLGQVLATRSDILPPDWIRELSTLHERVPAVPFAKILPQLTEDLGGSPSDVFARIDEEPLAAGSVAQVHRAQLADGREVAVKVRRPGAREEMKADLRLLERFAELLEQEMSELRRFRPRRTVRHFARTIKAELDFRIEAKNLRAIALQMAESDEVVIPEVIDELTRERLIVLSYLDGLSAADWIAGERPEDVDPKRVAAVGAAAVLEMVFENGLYHADPHPGNVLFLGDGRIGLLDFGMVGRLTEARRREFASLLAGIATQDENAIVDVLLDWADVGDPDVETLTQDARAFLDRYHGVPIGELDVTGMLRDVVDMVREANLVLPADVAMLVKVFVTLEGLGRALDPDFEMSEHIEPTVRRLIRGTLSPRAIVKRNMRDMAALAAGLPRDLRALLKRAKRGGFRVDLELQRLDNFGHQLERAANRLTVGILTASLIVGTSIAMTVDAGPALFDIPAIGLLGFLTSTVIGLGLLWSIFRS